MLVKFKTSVAGTNLHYSGGKTYDLPSVDANYWIREGLAELVEEQEEVRPLIVQEIKKPRKRPVSKK